jgi:hypothetical protein
MATARGVGPSIGQASAGFGFRQYLQLVGVSGVLCVRWGAVDRTSSFLPKHDLNCYIRSCHRVTPTHTLSLAAAFTITPRAETTNPECESKSTKGKRPCSLLYADHSATKQTHPPTPICLSSCQLSRLRASLKISHGSPICSGDIVSVGVRPVWDRMSGSEGQVRKAEARGTLASVHYAQRQHCSVLRMLLIFSSQLRQNVRYLTLIS